MAISLDERSPDGHCLRGRGRTEGCHRARRGGVPLRHVRRHAREAVRQVGPGLRHRRPHGRRRRLRRLRGRPDGPGPVVPGPPGHARRQLVHGRAVAARPRDRAVRPLRGRGAVAVRAPGHPPPPAGAPRRGRLHVEGRGGSRVLPGAADGRRGDHGGRRRGPGRRALLRRSRPDAHVRPPHVGVEAPEHHGVGELRQRPRGRQRAVRAELPLRGPPDDGGSRDRLPLHGPLARRGGGHGGDVHAQAVLPPHGERPAHAPQPVGRGRGGALRRPRRPARGSACRAPATPSSGACSTTPRP